jgi:uncharacterized phage protein gp47/JayE
MQFKRMSDVYSRLVNNTITNTNQINDFSVGSAMRAIYEAIAIEVESFYVLTQENMQDAINQGIYSSFGFTALPAVAAYGPLTITFNNPTVGAMVIARGTSFISSNPAYTTKYQTIQDYVVPAGSTTATITVYCTITGAIGNIPIDTIDVMNTPLSNVKSATNSQAFQTGQDPETADSMRARFQSYIKSLTRGTRAAIEYGTRSVQNIAGCYVVDQTGLVTVYAHDANGNLDTTLQNTVITTLDAYRPAGIPVKVEPVTRIAIDLSVTVTTLNKSANTTAFQAQIASAVTNYLNNMVAGQSLILSDLSSIIKYLDRTNIYDITFTVPSANVVIQGSELIRAGTVTVSLQ